MVKSLLLEQRLKGWHFMVTMAAIMVTGSAVVAVTRTQSPANLPGPDPMQLVADRPGVGVKVSRAVANAPLALGLTFDRRGRLLYAEKDSGRIIRVANGRKSVLAKLRVVGGGEDGLLGIATDRAGNVFASYTGAAATCPDPTRSTINGDLKGHCVWRFAPVPGGSGRLRAKRLVFSTGHPSSATNHVGGGIHIGPDGALYMGLGDLGENDDSEKGPARSQSVDVPYGKLLRMDPAGTNQPATGNPGYCNNVANDRRRAAGDKRIFACGLRNTYEFAFGPDRRLWGSEAGDSCDEINVVRAGVNYGWEPPRTDCAGKGAGKPFRRVTGTPAGIGVWNSSAAGDWRGDIFYCANSGGGELRRLDPTTRKQFVVHSGKCLLDLEPAPDARGIYFSDGESIWRLRRG